MANATDLPTVLDEVVHGLHRVVSELQRSEAIVVCAVQGTAAGAGFPLVAAADIVVAAESAKFALGYTKVGLSVDGGTSLLVHTLGLHRTLRIALLNDVLTAADAERFGLVARVVPDRALTAEAERIAATLISGPSSAQAATKAVIRQAADAEVEACLRREALTLVRQGGTADAAAGVSAFSARRHPTFT